MANNFATAAMALWPFPNVGSEWIMGFVPCAICIYLHYLHTIAHCQIMLDAKKDSRDFLPVSFGLILGLSRLATEKHQNRNNTLSAKGNPA